jgi:hypothetical protein
VKAVDVFEDQRRQEDDQENGHGTEARRLRARRVGRLRSISA